MKLPVPRLILYDGVCHFCAASVRFLLRHDAQARFHFAPLQSALGQQLCAEHGLNQHNFDTFVYARDGLPLRIRSDAALAVASDLGWPWKALAVLRLIPRPLRDALYDVIAKNRYRWFGQSDTCLLPTPEQRARFLESAITHSPGPGESPLP